jgi:isoaspartyl peptidase/L-asparaginase-like protein (Ntn-hydrolase superfamily)
MNTTTPPRRSRYALAIHGGAGTLSRAHLTPPRDTPYHDGLAAALRAGREVLDRGGSSIDAVTAAVVALEDCPLFNAGHGAVLNAQAEHELDAAIMDGASLAAGAVSAVHSAKNPVRLARAVMERSPHVLMTAAGADAFARAQGLEVVPQSYFTTPERTAALENARQRARRGDGAAASAAERHGTVGAVALDVHGNLAAATSTGGLTNKLAGRVGDSPVIGAGTYASNATCAVSATGDGEFFIRAVLAHDVSARIAYGGATLDDAAREALANVAALGGTGGLVAVDRSGRIVLPFNTEGMYRGHVREGEEPVTAIF